MVSRAQIEKIQPAELFLDRLPVKTRQAFLYFTKTKLLPGKNWYLAGGTALALHVGHRKSVDLDFFTTENSYKEGLLERKLLSTGKWVTTSRDWGTLYGEFMDAKASFIAYPFFTPSDRRLECGYVRILSPRDIASMKIIAISQRGRKRDFVDLYWYIRHLEPLDKILRRAIKQYPGQEHNLGHILKSLAYFEDADQETMPNINFKTSWKTIKAYFRKVVPQMTREYFGLK